MEQQLQTGSRFNFNKIFEYCLLVLVLLMPVMFAPSILVSLYASKIALLTGVIVIFIAAFLASTLSGGIIQFPKTKFLIPIALFPIIAFVSSFFSNQGPKSIAGQIFELGTSGSLFILTLLLFVAMFSIKEEAKVGVKAVFAFLISAGVVVLHLILRIFGASILPVSVASRIPNFLLGGSVDTSIFLGGTIIASLVVLNMLPLGRKTRIYIYALIAASLVFIGAIGFAPTTVLVGLFALIYFVYTFSWLASKADGAVNRSKTSFPSLFVLAIAIVLLLAGSSISGFLSETLKINTIEVRPNVSTTISLVGEAWKTNPILGVGPNMFKELWDLYKPTDINLSQFWAADFSFGSGLIPTLAATVGPLGLLALLVFFVLYAYAGFKSIFSSVGQDSWRFVSITSFLTSLFFWIMTFICVPGVAVVSLAMIFTGIFASTLAPQGVVGSFRANVFSNPKINFVSVFLIVVLLISSIAGGYYVWERVIANSIYQKGVNTLSAGDSETAQKTIAKAVQLAPTDLYWRSLAETSITKLGVMVSSVASPENMSDAQKTAIQTEIANAIEASNQAIKWNSKDYQNWFVLGRVYEILASNGINGVAQNADDAFVEAEKRAPSNPAIPLALGRMAAISGNVTAAREDIVKAINLKSNYTDAYYTLAQLEVATNNITGAIQSVEAATLIESTNAPLFFQLGLLKYNNSDFAGAAKAFEQAVALVPDYANAKYFLGLSYELLGKRDKAIAQFEDIAKTNSDNQEVQFILSNLKAGKSPFKDAKPPINNKPESRTELPVKEN